MKRRLCTFLFLTLILCLCLPGLAEESSDTAEWTVLFYICGADLESKYSCATGNLEEIAKVEIPPAERVDILVGDNAPSGITVHSPEVNVLIETGGASRWHARYLGMNISNRALQFWRYHASEDGGKGTFSLETERPLVSMADPSTLSEFIRWGTRNYPAKKYALVLWGHGGGSATGLFVDEMFQGEYMTLDLLKQAFADGGVHFETVLFDACMMANIETACAVQEHASWMVASEEIVAGKGTAIGDWLQQLYYVPGVDGRVLGRWICDTAMIKYSNSSDRQSQELITWSLIDLSKIKRLEVCFDRFFEDISIIYAQYPSLMLSVADAVSLSEPFGTGNENMYDFGGILYRPSFREIASPQRQQNIQEALADAVNYFVRGSGRANARGLSFCFATNFLSDKLDIYARNCPSVHYLALLDAISPWDAPSWVHEKVQKLPELNDAGIYHVTVEKKIWDNGSPAFSIKEGANYISTVVYHLYRVDETTGQTIRMGKVPVYYDPEEEMYRVYDLSKWPAVDGSLCQVELQNYIKVGNYNLLYNIPIMINSELMNMRCVYWFDKAEYEVLGLWDGYDNDSNEFNRNVMSLSQVAGREYRIIHDVVGGGRTDRPYALGPTMIMYRSLKLEELTLPPGTYYLEFAVYDLFLRPMPLERLKLNWDGQEYQILDDPWEGTERLDASNYYSTAKK